MCSGIRKAFNFQERSENDTDCSDSVIQYLCFLLDPSAGDPLVPG
jgi:hypothetical protein